MEKQNQGWQDVLGWATECTEIDDSVGLFLFKTSKIFPKFLIFYIKKFNPTESTDHKNQPHTNLLKKKKS